MTFLQIADFALHIRAELLYDVVGSDGTTDTDRDARLVIAETYAMADMKERISARYDVATIFTPPVAVDPEDPTEEETAEIAAYYAARYATLVRVMCQLTAYYYVKASANGGAIDLWETQRKEAWKWGDDVFAGRLNPDLPYRTDPDTGDALERPAIVRFGSLVRNRGNYLTETYT